MTQVIDPRGLRRSRRTPRAARLALVAGLAASLVMFEAPRAFGAEDGEAAAPAEPAGPAEFAEVTPADGGPRPLSAVETVFVRQHVGHPEPGELMGAGVLLARTSTGAYVAPREGARVVELTLSDIAESPEMVFYDSALAQIAPAIVRRMQALGFIGVYAEPDPLQVRVVDGRVEDRRRGGDTGLTYLITTGIVTEVRTSGLGERLPEGETVNNEVHRPIREKSPVRAGTDDDLLRRDRIDDYVFFLNRHPGRRVDVAVAATGEEPGAVSLDYLVTENRPWLLFAQLSNTGTEETNDWRQRFGFVHNQLTNADDIFSLEYLTAGFEDLNALVASYERPIFSDRLRFRAYGSWYEYTASDVGQAGADFTGDGYSVGAEASWNFFQDRDFFADLVGGLRYDQFNVDNRFASIEGEARVLVGYIGARAERVRDSEATLATVNLEFSLDGIGDDEVNTLGRLDADTDWALLQAAITHSFYLEPILDPDLREGRASLAHEVFLSARGQYSFNNRLVPNYQQVVGGLYTVRGYPQSVVAGDSTAVLTAEYRYHIPRGLNPNAKPGEFFGTPFRFVPQYEYGPTDWDFILRAFADVGWTHNAQRISALEENDTLVGIGLGAELALSRHVNARVDVGWALSGIEDAAGQTRVDEGDAEVHFVLTLVF